MAGAVGGKNGSGARAATKVARESDEPPLRQGTSIENHIPAARGAHVSTHQGVSSRRRRASANTGPAPVERKRSSRLKPGKHTERLTITVRGGGGCYLSRLAHTSSSRVRSQMEACGFPAEGQGRVQILRVHRCGYAVCTTFQNLPKVNILFVTHGLSVVRAEVLQQPPGLTKLSAGAPRWPWVLATRIASRESLLIVLFGNMLAPGKIRY